MSDVPENLTDRAEFTLVHCRQRMRSGGTRSTWQGRYPEGTQSLDTVFDCPVCGARLDITLVEPDVPRPRAERERLRPRE